MARLWRVSTRKSTIIMLYSLLSRILAGDFNWSQNQVWKALMYALLSASTYALWRRQRDNKPTAAVDEGGISRSISDPSSRATPGERHQQDNNPNIIADGYDASRPKWNTLNTAIPSMHLQEDNKLTDAVDESDASKSTHSSLARAMILNVGNEDTLEIPSSVITEEIQGGDAKIHAGTSKRTLTNKMYTVGWICAISTEYVAARLFLDEEDERPEYVSDKDDNDYTLGRAGKLNVVIAVLPDGEYGISSAASVAKDMMHSFPNVRIGLMVGIGGGAPSQEHDIRLGDIVVSAPRNGNSGVFQYDFGKTMQGQSFQTTSFLNKPPRVLLNAINGLKTEHKLHPHHYSEKINAILQTRPYLHQEYKRPDPSSDRLYRTEIIHHDKASCMASCGSDPSKLIVRRQSRVDENPAIHYGLVASANSLMKDAIIRDKLSTEKDVLCFEMEAAGLMNLFPCLVIRGICDYSDTHKNKEWQGYAAMVAAAYAKDLLSRIPSNKIEAERVIGDILSGIQENAVKQLDVANEHLQIEKARAKEELSKHEKACHQLFCLTADVGATYEWYKERVEERAEGTCMWLLEHKDFQNWLRQESGPLLVSADPGCGKSVLAKYLIDHYLPQSTTTICYFFFKDQDQNTIQQALCALLHQLFEHKPSLVKHALTQFNKDGENLINSTESLWKILQTAIQDPQAGPIIIVLDALDECAELEFKDLMKKIESQYRNNQLGKLKYLLTSRPYNQIVSNFYGLLQKFPDIHIPGEEESDSISQEVNHIIILRVNQLAEKKRLSPEVKSYLKEALQKTTHRTYLWVYLIFDYLEKEDFKKTLTGIKTTLSTLPLSVNMAYEEILKRSKDDPLVRKTLGIILAASRPLTLAEMNIAITIDYTLRSFQDLDLEEEDVDFKNRLRSWCGLFISIHHGKIYFLHQTAREFLLADSASSIILPVSESRWYHSISMDQACTMLAESCVLYLDLLNSDKSTSAEIYHKYSCSRTSSAACIKSSLINPYAFVRYSAEHWVTHFRDARINDESAIIPCLFRIYDDNLKSYSIWMKIHWRILDKRNAGNFTNLIAASFFGHKIISKHLLDKGAKVDSKDNSGQTPLLWAAKKGHEAVVKLLLEKGAKVDLKDDFGRTPLLCAADEGHEAIIKLLLEKGAEVDLKDDFGRTPLLCANGHEAIIKLLQDKALRVKESSDERSSSSRGESL